MRKKNSQCIEDLQNIQRSFVLYTSITWRYCSRTQI